MNTPAPTRHDVLILGAGMSGLAMAMALQRAGRHDFLIVDKSAGLGGTWWDNRYPGACVDVPAPLYSFSCAPHPGWQRRFAAAPEILAYMQGLASRHGLARHLRLGTAVRAANFDENRGRWLITLDSDEVIDARFFVCSTGPLSVPRWPAIEGLDSFAGPRLHSARWDNTVDMAGRRVGVIGTGSTASQLVPELAKQAARLTVFQRTPNWVLPRFDRAYGALDRLL
ncbi:MAG: NAD(P)/FAD-dependent oxidoreductase, partial [Rubrivivax sp.]|nr:NAD(P)/FAD-dependent oxidoreductase [Rubrivivax sp.]